MALQTYVFGNTRIETRRCRAGVKNFPTICSVLRRFITMWREARYVLRSVRVGRHIQGLSASQTPRFSMMVHLTQEWQRKLSQWKWSPCHLSCHSVRPSSSWIGMFGRVRVEWDFSPQSNGDATWLRSCSCCFLECFRLARGWRGWFQEPNLLNVLRNLHPDSGLIWWRRASEAPRQDLGQPFASGGGKRMTTSREGSHERKGWPILENCLLHVKLSPRDLENSGRTHKSREKASFPTVACGPRVGRI